VFGLVLYTGSETRSNMSAKKPRSKVGSLDWEINYLAKVLFCVMLVISLLIIVMDGFMGSWYFKYFRCLLLLCSIIPISMRINLDFAKLYYSYKINWDDRIKDTVARNSTIPEELGRIQFLLSDKTGTLTKNDMIFKKLNLEFYSFTEDQLDEIKMLLKKGLKKAKDRFMSMRHKLTSDITYSDEHTSMLDQDNFVHPPEGVSQEQSSKMYTSSSFSRKEGDASNLKGNPMALRPNRRGKRREQTQVILDLYLALILCHNVTPVYTTIDETTPDSLDQADYCLKEQSPDSHQKFSYRTKQFQAASPDEIALVKFAEQLGMILEEREEQFIKIRDPDDNILNYDILQIFPFSSETKRMGIIVRNKETN
jgi:phospholipid-translocating ATPase